MQAIKLTNLYRRNMMSSDNDGYNASDWWQASDMTALRSRLELDQVSVLAQTLHSYEMQLMVEIPAIEAVPDNGMMSLFLIQVSHPTVS